MKHKKIILSSFVAMSLAINASTNETTQLEEVNVWETQVISSSLNLGENAIETKQADHLSDLLRDLPGVEVGGSHSINNRINIRGLQDEDLNITLDGAKIQNVNMFHHIGNLLINPDILKKADIQVGTNSVTTSGLGGSVAFETKDGRDMLEKDKDFGARISSTYNSNNSAGGSLTGYGKVSNDVDFLLYHNYLNKNNWKDGKGNKGFGADGKIQNSLVKLGYNLSDTQRVAISYDILKDEGDYFPRPDMGANANAALTGLGKTFDTEYTRETITLKHELMLGDKLILDTSIYSNDNELQRLENWIGGPRSPRPDFVGTLKGNVKTVGINTKAQSNIELANTLNTFTYGATYDEQTSEVTWNSSKYGKDEEAKELALFAEDAIDFNNGIIITPGVRYTNYKLDSSYGNINDNQFTYGLATEYALTDTITLLASGTTLYKGVPMVDVLASDRTVMTQRGDLKAETGINKEIGFTYMNDNVLNADKVGFSFKYFRTDINDVIQSWDGNTPVVFNNGDLAIKGFETSFKVIKGDVTGLVTLSKSDTEFSATKKASNYEQGDKVTLGLNYKITRELETSWNSIFMKGSGDGIKSLEKAGYGVHDVSFKYTPIAFKNLSVIAGVDNIFDKEYIAPTSRNDYARGIFLGDYEPGRNYKVTVAYKF
ncbi:TonB-dependent receptor domain-containing protein [Arcobacter cloacae]|uniref:TonB-dependent siderophore receptor n=1 Tax=Arcobacter cloacae TaxID=1054034 RepID=A0A6M8NAK2_9BACT|nr:TonB-dependent receptor [Arcobacter cloacae]QKF91213.1 TonB-dependent receptor [Arcobacter cloacae]RXI40413.1 TonB-dependent siderophore receptor [Arcobacter cloacae]